MGESRKQFSLSDSVMSAVSGGVMPAGFYDELLRYMQGAAAEGVRAEDLIADLKDEYASGLPAGMTQKDVESVLKFVRDRWPKK